MIPAHPKIYHFTHLDSLPSIIRSGHLYSDAIMLADQQGMTNVGLSKIKQSRLTQRRVKCHRNIMVGECVPFYFGPRSIMLYVLHCDNNPDLTYHGGQQPLVYFEADMHRAIAWANKNQIAWAFTDCNAAAAYASFYKDTAHLDQIDWHAVAATDWREVQEQKQAEFLLYESFPWHLVDRIGVYGQEQLTKIQELLQSSEHKPTAQIKRGWYY